MDAFLVLGHGFEDPKEYDTRDVLPADTYLVTMTECGVASTSADDMFPIIEGMIAQPELFKDPETNQEHIIHLLRKGIRILGPGDPYPFLHTNLVINVSNKGSNYLAKSGIYKLPLTREDFSIWPRDIAIPDDMRNEAPYIVPLNNKNPMYLKVEQPRTILETLQTVYRGAIFPNEKTLETTVTSDPNFPSGIVGLGHLQEQFTQTLSQIFERLGPGVFYYPICRSIEMPMKNETLSPFRFLEELIIASTHPDKARDLETLKSIKQQTQDPASRLFTDKKLIIEAVYPLAEKYKNTDPENFPNAERFANALQQTIERVNTIRARSTEKQRTRRGGRKRKTRRMRRTIKTNRKYLN